MEYPMKQKINLELFRFNIETDYLPYYVKLQIILKGQERLADILEFIAQNLNDFGYSAYGFKINGVVIWDFKVLGYDLFKKFGTTWRIEPLNPHLALKDLEIDTTHFIQKVRRLEQFGFSYESDFVLAFLPLAYATPLSIEDSEYLGEAFFLLALNLYDKTKNPQIIEYISQIDKGIFNAQSLQTYVFPQENIYDENLNALKALALEKHKSFSHKLLKRLLG